MTDKYVIGLDYGTDSARAVVVNTLTGAELASSVKYYPRWAQGKYCNPDTNQYRQHPQDYIDVLEASVKEALAKCPEGTAAKVAGISFDTTGSTPVFTDKAGTASSRCDNFVAPIIGIVTGSFCSSHARATCRRGMPRLSATAARR